MRNLILFLFCFSAASLLFAQADNAPITYGHYRKIQSKTLGEVRTLLIRLPIDYEKPGKTYPVLYKLDGDKDVSLQTFAEVNYLADMTDKVPDHIVVGIENTDRGRDMRNGPGAEKFIQFIKTELIPFIDTHYRTNRFRILCGQSASSVFAMYSFLTQPDMFDAYILSSFGVQPGPGAPSLFGKEAKQSPARGALGRKYLFITNGKVDGYDPDGSRTKGGTLFLDALRQAVPATVLLKYKLYDEEGHVPFPSIYDGLKWIYSNEKAATK